jgi:precorrin-6Y C5,15-methyltransferase (decarboxylating)
MADPIYIIGVGADGATGLRPDLRERIVQADFLAGGERHLRDFPTARGERFVLKDNVESLSNELDKRYPAQRCVVLASGDPLFYGIGTVLVAALGSARLQVEPTLSSMQLAFARAGISWQGAALASIHGRDHRAILLPLLGRPLIGLFTQDGAGPAVVAQFFLRYGLAGYQAVVGENLGAADERLTVWPDLEQLAAQHFGALNYLVLQRRPDSYTACLPWQIEGQRALVPGAPDHAFGRPAGERVVMTGQEVRAVVLAKLLKWTAPGDVLWDIGAGVGTVAIEAAVLRSYLEVLAIERDAARAAAIQQNRALFDAYNVRVIEGEAPEALLDEAEPPRLIFIGGSGNRLPAILDLVANRIRDGGRLVANFVTLEHMTLALQRLRDWGWPFEVTEIQVSRSDALAGLTGLKPQRGVFLVSASKPGRSHD